MTTSRTMAVEGEAVPVIRRLILALMLFGMTGLLLELLILEHYEAGWQWTPLILLTSGLLTGGVLWFRPSRRNVLVFRGLMVAYILAAAVGIGMHYADNVDPDRGAEEMVSGVALVWLTIRGGTPALAPGALAQLGILGLILAYRHPALGAPSRGERAVR